MELIAMKKINGEPNFFRCVYIKVCDAFTTLASDWCLMH